MFLSLNIIHLFKYRIDWVVCSCLENEMSALFNQLWKQQGLFYSIFWKCFWDLIAQRLHAKKSWCPPFLWAHLFQFPAPVLIWDYISQREYINRQITMPLPESNLSAELCLKNKKPLQTVCAYRYIEPDAGFPVNGWDCETVFYCWTFSLLVTITGISALFYHTSM